jgi:hypothetical protein
LSHRKQNKIVVELLVPLFILLDSCTELSASNTAKERFHFNDSHSSPPACRWQAHNKTRPPAAPPACLNLETATEASAFARGVQLMSLQKGTVNPICFAGGSRQARRGA